METTLVLEEQDVEQQLLNDFVQKYSEKKYMSDSLIASIGAILAVNIDDFLGEIGQGVSKAFLYMIMTSHQGVQINDDMRAGYRAFCGFVSDVLNEAREEYGEALFIHTGYIAT